MSDTKQPEAQRELWAWVAKGTCLAGEPFGTHSSNYIKFIEHSAYLKVKAERDEANNDLSEIGTISYLMGAEHSKDKIKALQSQLDIAVGALEKAEIDLHSFADKFSYVYPSYHKFALRSAYSASDALAKIKGGEGE